jgi:hypothetical protein
MKDRANATQEFKSAEDLIVLAAFNRAITPTRTWSALMLVGMTSIDATIPTSGGEVHYGITHQYWSNPNAFRPIRRDSTSTYNSNSSYTLTVFDLLKHSLESRHQSK